MENLCDINTAPTPDKEKQGCFVIGRIKGGIVELEYYNQGKVIKLCSSLSTSDGSLLDEIDSLCRMVNSHNDILNP